MQPLAFFWDIENCTVPLSKSTFTVVQRLRERFGCNLAEVEFIVVCDVNKERPDVIEDLNDSQVTVIHVKAIAKNACDDKLRTSMTKFSMLYRSPGVVVLISSDVNFAHALTDLRYRCGFRIVLLHNENVSKTLLLTANEHYDWQNDVLATIADRVAVPAPSNTLRLYKLFVTNLPNVDEYKIRTRLSQLTDNCGGRVCHIDTGCKTAIVSFLTLENATRAQRRIDGHSVYGRQISVRLMHASSNRSNAAASAQLSPPQVQPLCAAPAQPSVSFIGPSTLRHHFVPTIKPKEPVASVRVEAVAENNERVSTSSIEDADIIEVGVSQPAAESDMKSARDHRLESSLTKERRVSFNVADDDDGLDFTPVKMTEGNGSSEPAPDRRHRHGSGSPQTGPSSDRQAQSPPSKLRLLERFAREAVELLRASPQCRMSLSRFSSAWCSYFNRPLRLSEFGCGKLTDLLAEVSDRLQIVDTKEKWVTLTPALLKSALQDQIVSILRQQPFHRAPMDRLVEFYHLALGYALNLRWFGFDKIEDVLANMRGVVEIETTDNGVRVVNLVEYRHQQMLANQLLYMFIRCPERRLASWQLENEFRSEFGVEVTLADVKNYLSDLVIITEYDAETAFIELNRIQRLALRLRRILVLNGGELPLSELEQIYNKHYGERIALAEGISGGNRSVVGILRSASHVLYLKGRGAMNCNVCINRNFLSSLKELKPDLFIPSEAPKTKKRGNGYSPRSQSLSENRTQEPALQSFDGNQGDILVKEKRDDPVQADGESAIANSQLDRTNSEKAVLIAGSGSLPVSPIPFSFPSLPIRAPLVTNQIEVNVQSESLVSNAPPPVRRSRLAANFQALPKD